MFAIITVIHITSIVKKVSEQRKTSSVFWSCFYLPNLPFGAQSWDSCTAALTDLLIAEYLALNKCSHPSTFNQPTDYLLESPAGVAGMVVTGISELFCM